MDVTLDQAGWRGSAAPRCAVVEIGAKPLAVAPGRYDGRCAVVELPGVPPVWALFYHEASRHWACHDGVLHVRFSRDFGESWSAEGQRN